MRRFDVDNACHCRLPSPCCTFGKCLASLQTRSPDEISETRLMIRRSSGLLRKLRADCISSICGLISPVSTLRNGRSHFVPPLPEPVNTFLGAKWRSPAVVAYEPKTSTAHCADLYRSVLATIRAIVPSRLLSTLRGCLLRFLHRSTDLRDDDAKPLGAHEYPRTEQHRRMAPASGCVARAIAAILQSSFAGIAPTAGVLSSALKL